MYIPHFDDHSSMIDIWVTSRGRQSFIVPNRRSNQLQHSLKPKTNAEQGSDSFQLYEG